MKIGRALLAAALTAFAFAALPSLASAEIIASVEDKHFTVANEGDTHLTAAGSDVKCTSVTGTGEFDANESKTGTLSLTFHGCESAETKCASFGHTLASQTITATGLTFHLVTATDADGNKADGVLITPPANATNTGGTIGRKFAEFRCAFGLVTIEVFGNGIIGEITSPETEVASNTFTFNFAADSVDPTTQEFETTCETGATEFDLKAYINDTDHSDPPATALQEGKGTMTFTNGGKGTLLPTVG